MTSARLFRSSVVYVACTALVYRDVAMASDYSSLIELDPNGIRSHDVPVSVMTNATLARLLEADSLDLDLAAIATLEVVNEAGREDAAHGAVVLGFALDAWAAIDEFRGLAIMHALDFDLPTELHTRHYEAVRAQIAAWERVGLTKAFRHLPPAAREHLRETRTRLVGVRSGTPRYVAGPASWA
jgi:hypothetical protein